MLGIVSTFWKSAGSSNIMFIIIIGITLWMWNGASERADTAEARAQEARTAIISNNKAGVEALVRARESVLELELTRERMKDDEENKEFYNILIPDSIREWL